MPIIINELEIVPPTAPEVPDQSPGDMREAAQPPTPPDPFDILRVEQIYRERRRRLWAD